MKIEIGPLPLDIIDEHIIPFKKDLEARELHREYILSLQELFDAIEDEFIQFVNDLLLAHECASWELEDSKSMKQENHLHEVYVRDNIAELRDEICLLIHRHKRLIHNIETKYDQAYCDTCLSHHCRTCYIREDLKTAKCLCIDNS